MECPKTAPVPGVCGFFFILEQRPNASQLSCKLGIPGEDARNNGWSRCPAYCPQDQHRMAGISARPRRCLARETIGHECCWLIPELAVAMDGPRTDPDLRANSRPARLI